MCAFTYAHLCIHLQVLLRAYVFESHKISIYKKIVVFSVFLPENYLDEVTIWGSKSDGVDSCRDYSSLHILMHESQISFLQFAYCWIFLRACLEVLWGGGYSFSYVLDWRPLLLYWEKIILFDRLTDWPTEWATSGGKHIRQWGREGTPT